MTGLVEKHDCDNVFGTGGVSNGTQAWKFYYDEDGQRIYKTSVSGTTETPVAAFPSVG